MRAHLLTKDKPFPNKVNFDAVEKYKWIWLMLLANMKHGSPEHCRSVIEGYGGSDAFAADLYEALQEMIDPDDHGLWQYDVDQHSVSLARMDAEGEVDARVCSDEDRE